MRYSPPIRGLNTHRSSAVNGGRELIYLGPKRRAQYSRRSRNQWLKQRRGIRVRMTFKNGHVLIYDISMRCGVRKVLVTSRMAKFAMLFEKRSRGGHTIAGRRCLVSRAVCCFVTIYRNLTFLFVVVCVYPRRPTCMPLRDFSAQNPAVVSGFRVAPALYDTWLYT